MQRPDGRGGVERMPGTPPLDEGKGVRDGSQGTSVSGDAAPGAPGDVLAELTRTRQRVHVLEGRLDRLQAYVLAVEADRDRAHNLYAEARTRLQQAGRTYAALRQNDDELRASLDRVSVELHHAAAQAAHHGSQAAAAHATLEAVYGSRSWRFTRLLRREWRREDATPKQIEPPPSSRARIAVVAHVFHEHLWEPLRRQLGNIPEPYDLFVSLSVGFTDSLKGAVETQMPSARVVVTDNRGREALPFMGWLRSDLLDGYAAVLRLRTPAVTAGSPSPESLWHELLPSPEGVQRMVELLARPDGPSCLLGSPTVLTLDHTDRELLLEMLGPNVVDEGRAPATSGSRMSWLSADAVQLLKGIHLQADDFEAEQGQVGGTRVHAFDKAVATLLAARGLVVMAAVDA